jgi:hypothetical protein
MLPGGRIFGQKAQRGREKKLAEEFKAEFWPNLP